MWGNATLAMLVSSTSINAASETAAAMIHGLPLGCQIPSPEVSCPAVLIGPSHRVQRRYPFPAALDGASKRLWRSVRWRLGESFSKRGISCFLLCFLGGSRKNHVSSKFRFGLEPIIHFIATDAVPLKIKFIRAAPDFFVTWRAIWGSIFRERLDGVCMKLQNLISLVFLAHKRVPFFRR